MKIEIGKSFLAMVVILSLFAGSLLAQQSTTGPIPPQGIDRGLYPQSRSQITIAGVPAYIWQNGCGPTAVGMVIGYWDVHGCPDMVVGDASTQTADVDAMIANDNGNIDCGAALADHYRDYSCPIDTSPNMLQDKSQTGGAHASDCVADFMRTSWSSVGNYYGWSYSDDVPGSFESYVNLSASQYDPTATNIGFSSFSWDDYKAEIDAGRPVVLLVDTDGNGSTDHFVTGIGYDDATMQYGVHDTWDTSVHWFSWRGLAAGNDWGIYGVTTFRVVPQKKWTVLVYVNGDNELEGDAIADINEMEVVGSSNDVNIVVQVDRIPGHDNSNGDWTDTRRYYVTRDNDQSTIGSQRLDTSPNLGELDMGDPQTLVDFVNWGIDHYPSDRYAVIVWDHGSGWIKGAADSVWAYKSVSSDFTSGNSIEVSNGEWESAISAIRTHLGRNIELVGFDACLMQMWEVLHINKAYADIAVGSEELEGAQGWSYNNFLDDLLTTPSMSATDLAKYIVNSAVDNSGLETQSAINLSQIDALSNAVNAFAQNLFWAAGHGHATTLAGVRNATQSFCTNAECTQKENIDLYDFADRVAATASLPQCLKDAANVVKTKITEAVLLSRHLASHGGANGIAIYHPLLPYDSRYDNLAIADATLWNEFVRADGYSPEYATIKGVQWLKENQQISGNQGWWNYNGSQSVGVTGLAVVALVNAQVPYSDPVIQRAMQYIVNHNNGADQAFYVLSGTSQTYETAMALLAMQAVNTQAGGIYDTYINWARNYLLNGRNPEDGGWRYYSRYYPSDLSVTQWPAFALYEGSYADQTLWNAVKGFALSRQKANGEFTYGAGYGQGGGAITGAGLWCLLFSGSQFSDANVQMGVNWLLNNWSVTECPGFSHGGAYYYYYYYMYSLAKACDLTGQTLLGSHDWFSEISNQLISIQSCDGSWPRYQGQSEYDHYPTVMSLLSLGLKGIPVNSSLKFTLKSHADLHVTFKGQHTGLNYSTVPPIIELGIPNSDFQYVGPDSVQVITIDPIQEGGSYGYYLEGTGTGDWQMEVTGLQDGELVYSDTVNGSIIPDLRLGCDVKVTGSGGDLIVIPCDPDTLPCLATSPGSVAHIMELGDTVTGQFYIRERCGAKGVNGINLIPYAFKEVSSDITLPASTLALTPAHFDSIPAGDSVLVSYQLALQANMTCGHYQGTVGIETVNAGNHGITFDLRILYNCGDFDGSRDANIADAVYLLNYIFKDGAAPLDVSGGDANCDGGANIADAVFMVNYIFLGGPAPCSDCK